jgi:hypothetical protein
MDICPHVQAEIPAICNNSERRQSELVPLVGMTMLGRKLYLNHIWAKGIGGKDGPSYYRKSI